MSGFYGGWVGEVGVFTKPNSAWGAPRLQGLQDFMATGTISWDDGFPERDSPWVLLSDIKFI